MSAAATLVVFADDWGRHPSSCQHLVQRFVGARRVLWVNTIGSRTPAIDAATLRRGAEKLSAWVRTPSARTGELSRTEDTVVGPEVLSPVMWPSFRGSVQRSVNRRLLLRSVNAALIGTPTPRVAVTTLPLVADLVGGLDVDRWLYYCVDDLAEWPGLDGSSLRCMENELVSKVDGAVAVSEHLRERLAGMGRSADLISHGVDLDHWARPGRESSDRETAVFWGLIDQRMESEWVQALAERLEGRDAGEVVLAGPIEFVDDQLRRHPRVRTIGATPYDELPTLAHQAGVLIMPYRDLPATRAMQPLKMKEYLATGRPCVVRRLPATEPWSDCLDTVDSAEEFAATTLERMSGGLPPEQATARSRLVEETWDAKAMAFAEAIDSLLHREISPIEVGAS